MSQDLTWNVLPPPCPNCGIQVRVGIMNLQATCQCGWVWRDVVVDELPRGWYPPSIYESGNE